MAKGEDAVTRKKNKVRRRRMNQDKSSVSARVASIIAAKKRRLSGKRRKCQGMCFSLPTPEDPFNDTHGKKDFRGSESEKNAKIPVNGKVNVKGKTIVPRKEFVSGNEGGMNDLEHKDNKAMNLTVEHKTGFKNPADSGSTGTPLNGKSGGRDQQRKASEILDYPSRFLIMCLNEIEKELRGEGNYSEEEYRPLYAEPWGVDFLQCYSTGRDLLETSGSSCTIKQIAWMVSTAADTIARKEKHGLSFATPFLLFLVPSQEKAAKVRMVCKPLKAFGIHTVSLHAGASLDYQIQGLKKCEPEFLVSTPERLLELVHLKAVDISSVSFLVVDELESFYKDGRFNTLKSIRQSFTGNPNTVVFNNICSDGSPSALQDILSGPICRLSRIPCTPNQSELSEM